MSDGSDDPVVYVTREIPEAGLELLEPTCELHVWDGKLPPDTDHVVDRLAELEATGCSVCSPTRWTAR